MKSILNSVSVHTTYISFSDISHLRVLDYNKGIIMCMGSKKHYMNAFPGGIRILVIVVVIGI